MMQEKILKTTSTKIHVDANADKTVAAKARPAKPYRRMLGRREIIILAVALALLAFVPTMAQRMAPAAEVYDTARNSLGPAERADENFAGSAFYFMEQDYALPPGEELHAALGQSLETRIGDDRLPNGRPSPVTGIASPMILRPGSVAYSRALKCLSDAIYYEAANEPDSGQRGVAQVILNRMQHPTYPNTVCGVIYQGSERRTGCQFSYSCDGSMRRTPSTSLWLRGQRVAAQALGGYVHKPVGMATHYHATYVYPYWAPSLKFLGTIGAHRFYSWKGSAGRPSAFFKKHAGSEPFPGPKPRKWTPNLVTPPAELDPIELQKKYEREYAAARLAAERKAQADAARSGSVTPPSAYRDIQPQRQQEAPKFSVPDYSSSAKKSGGEAAYSGTKLPQSTNIKPEFQNSGTWKQRPTG